MFNWDAPDLGVDATRPLEPLDPADDPDDAEKVRFLSIARLTTDNISSRNFLEEAPDSPELSWRTS